MRKIIKGFFKFVAVALSIAVVLSIIAGLWFGIKGYNMYRDAVNETPFSEKFGEIQNAGNFTEFDELPEIYVKAVVAVEDERFWTHHGVDGIAICRAVFNDIKTLSLREGGSTITQQLMKNEYFTQDKKFERKFAEIFAALKVEKEYDKREIFELYVNTIYFGRGLYGIHDAAMGYFGKTPSELTDYEAVMLAGIPNAPSVYDTDQELDKQRMRQVLDRMVECGVISETESDQIFSSE